MRAVAQHRRHGEAARRCTTAPRVLESAGVALRGAAFPDAGEGERAKRPPRPTCNPVQLAAVVVVVREREGGGTGMGRDKEEDKMLDI